MKLWVYVFMAFAALMMGWLVSCSMAFGYPEVVRMGYGGCASCHLNPSGGGVLTNYGRSAGEEMATWAPDGSGWLLGAVPDVKWAVAGGDIRAASTTWAYDTNASKMSDQGFDNSKTFPMQAEGEVAVRPAPTVWLDGSLGYYGPDHARQLRRNYALWTPDERLSAKVGRFVPAYGINTPDHTAATRSGLGLGQDGERLAAEGSVRGEWGEVSVAETFASEAEWYVDGNHGYSLYGGRPGWVLRMAGYALGSTFGLSAWRRPSDNAFGPFASIRLWRYGYVLMEGDRVLDRTTGDHHDFAWSEVGWEVVRGLHLQLTGEYEDGPRWGAGFQWIPYPHFEFVGRVKKQADVWTAAGVAHVWL